MVQAMIRKFLILASLAVSLSFAAEESSPAFQGPVGRPVFNDRGDMSYVFKKSQSEILLATIPAGQNVPESLMLPLGPNAFSPQIKTDREGKTWVIWEEWEQSQSQIFCGELDKDKIKSRQAVDGQAGINLSPDLAFDEYNSPWVVWLNTLDSSSRILVKNLALGEIRAIHFSSHPEIGRPKILIDSRNRIWIFWTEKGQGEEDIFYKTYQSGRWSRLEKALPSALFPRTNPDVASAEDGSVWLVWSEYDGKDYEIFCARWEGTRWSRQEKITDQTGANNLFPSISLAWGTEPIVAWNQSSRDRNLLCVRFRKAGAWSDIVPISTECGPDSLPRTSVEKATWAVVWLDLNTVRSQKFNLFELATRQGRIAPNFSHSPKPFSPTLTRIIFNPALNENMYIGFGDSITAGPPPPDQGYIPRLSVLLNNAFGPTEVVNEGRGGELTAQGLERIETVIDRNQARYLLLLEGTNDVVILEVSIESATFNLREMIRKCLDYGLFPAISTLLPRRDFLMYFPQYINRFTTLNQNIRQMAADLGIPLVDLYEVFKNYPESDGGLLSLLSDDLKHPSPKGYQVMADHWAEAIQAYPFPPVHLQIKKDYDKVLFYQKPGNMIGWQANPKTADQSLVKGYKIYRRKEGEAKEKFQLLAFVVTPLRYFDTEIDPLQKYEYVISTLRTDGMEGPCSELVAIR